MLPLNWMTAVTDPMATSEAKTGDSPTVIGRINPLTKVTVIACAVIAGLLSGLWYLAAFFVLGMVAVALNRRLGSFIKLFVIAMVPMGLIIFVLNLVAVVGTPVLWRWAFLTVTEPGLQAAIHFTNRFLVIGVGVMVMIHTTSIRRFARDLEQRGLSPKATYVMQSTGLILPQLVGRGAVILDAQRARGIETDSNILVRAKALLPSAAPLILSTLTGMAERAVSLEARGMTIDGPRTSLLHVNDTVLDKVIRWLAVAALLAYIGWKVWQWTR